MIMSNNSIQMDDIIALIRWSLAVRRKCVIRAIPVATLSGMHKVPQNIANNNQQSASIIDQQCL